MNFKYQFLFILSATDKSARQPKSQAVTYHWPPLGKFATHRLALCVAKVESKSRHTLLIYKVITVVLIGF